MANTVKTEDGPVPGLDQHTEDLNSVQHGRWREEELDGEGATRYRWTRVMIHDNGARAKKRSVVIRDCLGSLFPGVTLCVFVASISIGVEKLENHELAHPYVEGLVLAIFIGMAIRALWHPSECWQTGIAFSAKELLEIAVMLLGASISFGAVAASGPLLLAAIATIVIITLSLSFGLSRMLGLSTRLSLLIACGNSICGNSAIAAVAPVIGADADDIASSISFTAMLGALIVLGLPLLVPLLQLSATEYGIIAGLTVYAVPQVLAATLKAGLVSTQIATLVKLVRVLMLGPIVVFLSLIASQWQSCTQIVPKRRAFRFFRFVPWFIVGFIFLATLRSFEIVPGRFNAPLTTISTYLTVISMAALGLSVDLRVVASLGGRVTLAVTLSLLLLLSMSIGLIYLLK